MFDAAMQTALAHHRAGRLRQAEQLYRQALAADPNHADALHLLGFAAHQSGRSAEGITLIERAITLSPDVPDYYHNLAVVCSAVGRYADAQAAWRRTLALRPGDSLALKGLAKTAEGLGLLAEAISYCRQLTRLYPNDALGWGWLGNALQLSGEPDEAIDACRHALALAGDDPLALHTLANAFKDRGEIRRSIRCLRRALSIAPQSVRTFSNLLYTLHFDPSAAPREIEQEHWLFNITHARPLEQAAQPHAAKRAGGRRLRIGYVSPDFRAHSTSFFTLPLLERHDRRRFEVFAYADVLEGDQLTARAQSACDHWRNIAGKEDADVAGMIRADEIDILVDLALHTANARPLLFARKPAPLQVSWLGYPGTTGLLAMDYRVSDVHLDPPDEEAMGSFEKILRLPRTMWCYQPSPDSPQVGPLPAERNGFLTFGCLNNFSKVNAQVLELWGGVMNAVAHSRLLLLAPPGESRARVLSTLERRGIAAARITFIEKTPWLQYMHRHQQIDLLLDTFPWNGHTMSLDALWMGVPVITLRGQLPVSRAGDCFLSNLELQSLVARSTEQYIDIAVSLSRDIPSLAALRASLRERMSRSPLVDAPRFAADFESALIDAYLARSKAD